VGFFQPPVPNAQILLAEDDDAMREMLADALRQQGFHVRAAADGLTALRLLDEFNPHAVVLDLVLPLASGFDILEELRAGTARSVPVIAISGDDQGLRRARKNRDFFATLQKPFDPEVLVLTVSRAMRQQAT
jgi:DNA-binding response OmpR family regulator